MPAPYQVPIPRRSAIERGSAEPLVDLLDPDPIVRGCAIECVELDAVGLYALRERLLDDSHAPVRLAAGERLARASASRLAGLVDWLDWLVRALRDPMPSVREVACRGLARHGTAEQCSDALARLVVSDGVWWVRRAAARALAAVAGEAAIPALLPGLEDPFWRVRHGVVAALDLIVTRSSSDEAERERLRRRVLEAGAEFLRGEAGRSRPEPTGGGLRAKRADGDDALRESARAALAYLASGWPEGEGDLVAVARGRELADRSPIDPRLADADPAVVTARLRAAAEVDPASLIPLLAESHEALRVEAARRLAALDDPICLAPALAWLEDPRMPNAPATVRALLRRLGGRARGLAERALASARPGGLAWAAEWIAEHAAEDLHAALLGHAEHERAEVRLAIMRALGRLLARERGGDAVLREHLLAGLGDREIEVRDAAALALLEARVVEPLAGMLEELSAGVRARVLPELGDPSLGLAYLEDASAQLRAAAVATLARAGRLDAACRRRALDDPDPWLRLAALDLDAAVTVFEPTSRERDPAVRRAAARMIVAARARLEPGLAHGLFERLGGRDGDVGEADPWLRARAAELVDTDGPQPEQLRALLLATRDRAAMVRLAASAALDRIPELAPRLEAILASSPDLESGQGPLRIATWSRLCATLEPEQAAARLERAVLDERDEDVRAHLRGLALMFGGEPAPAPAPVVEVLERSEPAAPRPRPTAHRRALGRSGLELAPLIVSGAFSPTPSSLAMAVERGVDTLFWEPRYINSTRFLRQARRRDLQVVAGSFHADRRGLLADLETARRRLRRDHIDLFLLFWVRSPARLGAEALACLREFVERGWIRSYGFSTHDRAIACEAIAGGDWPVIMTRHSAAHTGAEQELLPAAAAAGVGVLGFSALCYGRMLRSSSVFERGPAAVDCYRYSLAQPAVAACISAPRRHRELEHNLALLDDPTLDDDRRDALRAHGTEVYADNERFNRLLRRGGAAPLREAILELFERESDPDAWGSELARR